jgi:MFS family permease
VQFLTLNRWGRLADMFGNRLLLITTGSIITVIPSLWLVSTHYAWLLAVQALSGLAWAGFTLSATAFVFDLTPSEHRATLFAVHNIFAALAVFLGASAGALLVLYVPEQISLLGKTIEIFTPLYGLFLLSCLTRITVALLFLPRLKEVRRVRPMSMSGLIFRVTRMHPISGLIYEVVGRARLNRPRDSADGD